MSTYQKWSFTLPAELEEIFSAELWSRGVLGVEIRPLGEGFEGVSFTEVGFEGGAEAPTTLELDAFFADPPPEAAQDLDVGHWAERGVVRTDTGIFADQDWLAVYRKSAEPIDVGERFRLDPREPEATAEQGTAPRVEDGRFVLRLPARTAFGTGSHESTRLVLRCLEALAADGRLEDRSVLDVGTGSGVLAFACLLLGSGPVVGYDLDPEALWMARINSGLNRLEPRWFAGRPMALAPSARFDVLLVNVLPERIRDDLPGLVGHLAPGGVLLSSGNLVTQRTTMLDRFASLGLEPTDERIENEWVAWVLRSGSGG